MSSTSSSPQPLSPQGCSSSSERIRNPALIVRLPSPKQRKASKSPTSPSSRSSQSEPNTSSSSRPTSSDATNTSTTPEASTPPRGPECGRMSLRQRKAKEEPPQPVIVHKSPQPAIIEEPTQPLIVVKKASPPAAKKLQPKQKAKEVIKAPAKPAAKKPASTTTKAKNGVSSPTKSTSAKVKSAVASPKSSPKAAKKAVVATKPSSNDRSNHQQQVVTQAPNREEETDDHDYDDSYMELDPIDHKICYKGQWVDRSLFSLPPPKPYPCPFVVLLQRGAPFLRCRESHARSTIQESVV